MLFGDAPISPGELLQELVTKLRSHDAGKTWSKGENKAWTDAVKLALKEIGEHRSATTRNSLKKPVNSCIPWLICTFFVLKVV
jgi:hypothetical protein